MPRTPAVMLAALTLSVGPALAQATADPLAARVDSLFARYDASPSPGLAVAVVRDGRVILRRGYGMADVERGVRITPSTVFDIASLSKQFTGLAIAMLVSEGRIRLEDDVRTYIPELPRYDRPITIAHLLHHTSGVRDWPGALSIAGIPFEDPISYQRILEMAYRQRTLNFTPGDEELYSNTGYNLLAEVVQRVRRQPFRDWADARFFRPLGMARTHVRASTAERFADQALGYEQQDDGSFRRVQNQLQAVGSSSIFSTVDDMARWMINFDGQTVGGPAALALMRQPGRLNDGAVVQYAFGVANGTWRGQPMFSHSGSWAEFSTFMAILPRQRFGVVVLANSGSIDAQRAVIDIANIYLDRELPRESPASSTPRSSPPASLPARLLDEYAGLYRLGPGWLLRIRRAGAGLEAQASHEDAFPMEPRSRTEFWIPAYRSSVIFQRDDAGRVSGLRYRGIRAPRLAESRPPANLAGFAGEYASDELQTSYSVRVVNGALELRHARYGALPLTWLWRDEFGTTTWFLRSIRFERDGSGRVVRMVVNGDSRNRDVRFVRR